MEANGISYRKVRLLKRMNEKSIAVEYFTKLERIEDPKESGRTHDSDKTVPR